MKKFFKSEKNQDLAEIPKGLIWGSTQNCQACISALLNFQLVISVISGGFVEALISVVILDTSFWHSQEIVKRGAELRIQEWPEISTLCLTELSDDLSML